MFWELLLDMHTIRVEKKLLLSLLSMETSLGNEEGGSDQQLAPYFLNEAFQQKSHDKSLEITIKNPMTHCF